MARETLRPKTRGNSFMVDPFRETRPLTKGDTVSCAAVPVVIQLRVFDTRILFLFYL
jgi:hypothetical protein